MTYALQIVVGALLLGCTTAERTFAAFEKYIDRGCYWEFAGTTFIAELSGQCTEVLIDPASTDFLNSTWHGSTTVGQRYSLVDNRYVLAETFSDPNCHGNVSQLHYSLDQCLNLTLQQTTLQRPLLEYAIVTVLNSTEEEGVYNQSEPDMVYASAVYYPQSACEAPSTPYPIKFIPGRCYQNVTDILPPEIKMLKGAEYPPLFPLAAVRASVSDGFLNFFFFADPNCTIHRDMAQSVSFGLDECTRLTRNSTVLVSVTNASLFQTSNVAEITPTENIPSRSADLPSLAAPSRLSLAGVWSAVIAATALVCYL